MTTKMRCRSIRRASRASDREVCVAFVLVLVLALTLGAVPARADHPSVSLGSGAAHALNTESAVSLDHGMWSVGIRSEYVRFREYSNGRLRGLRRRDPDADLHSVDALLATSLGVFYGVTDDLTLGLRLPYVRRFGIREPVHGIAGAALSAAHVTGAHNADGGGNQVIDDLGNVDGIGDLSLFGQWRFLERAPWHVALLAGLDVPVGETSAHASNGERVETEFQPGSGAVDGLLGLAGTFAADPVTVDASAVYTIAGAGSRDTNLGDVFAYGVALSHRLGAHGQHGHDHDHATAHRLLWDVFLEVNGEWREREVARGVRDDNSGGVLLWLSPGARLTIGGRLALGLSLGIPIAEDLNGDQVRPSYRIVSSVGLVF